MSINQTRKFLEKSGCGTFTMIAFGLALVVGLAYFGSMGGRQSATEEPVTVIATVKGQPVSAQGVENAASLLLSQMGPQDEAQSPEVTAAAYAQAVFQKINQAAILSLAKQKGVSVSDEDVLRQAEKEAEQQLEILKMQLSLGGKLKQGASEQEIQRALKENFGAEGAELKKRYVDRIRQALQDPARRDDAIAVSAGALLNEAYVQDVSLSDAELKESFNKWITKRIILKPEKHPKETYDQLNSKLEKVLAEIKGGMSFEAAMNKYTDDEAVKGQAKSDATVDFAKTILETDPALKPLLDLKPGETTGVIRTSTGPAIFKVIKIQPAIPADFEAKKQEYRAQQARVVGPARLQSDLEKLRSGDAISWKSPGFRLLYEWNAARTDPKLVTDKKALRAKLEEIRAEAGKVATEGTDIAGPRPALLAQYMAFKGLEEGADAAERKRLDAIRIETYLAVLETVESPDLRLELARLYADAKKGAEAAESLLNAAEGTFSFSDQGLERHKRMIALKDRLKKEGLADEAALKRIEEELARWRADLFDYLKAQAESNQDYSEAGQQLYNEINSRLAKFRSLGYINEAQAREIEALQKTWREEKLKAEKEAEEERKAAEAKRKVEAQAKKPEGATRSPTAGGAGK